MDMFNKKTKVNYNNIIIEKFINLREKEKS